MENHLFNHICFLMGDGTGRRFNNLYELLASSILQLYYLSFTLLCAVIPGLSLGDPLFRAMCSVLKSLKKLLKNH